MNNTLNTFLAEIVFAKPFFLWLLLALPLLWFRFRDRRFAVLLARSLILALVILTLADPQSASEESRDQERIFAYDVSDSIPTSMRDWMKSSARPAPAPSRHDRVFVFGAARPGSATGEKYSMAIAPRMPARRRKKPVWKIFSTRFWRCPPGRAVFTYLPTVGKIKETSNAFCRRSRPRESRFIRSCLPGVRRLPMSP